jgi:hypothetical protein
MARQGPPHRPLYRPNTMINPHKHGVLKRSASRGQFRKLGDIAVAAGCLLSETATRRSSSELLARTQLHEIRAIKARSNLDPARRLGPPAALHQVSLQRLQEAQPRRTRATGCHTEAHPARAQGATVSIKARRLRVGTDPPRRQSAVELEKRQTQHAAGSTTLLAVRCCS